MPAELSVQVKGGELTRQGLQNLKADVPKIGQQAIYNVFVRARSRVTTYPPPPPGSRYRRTYTYKRGWTIRKNPSATRAIAGYTLVGRAVQRGRDYTKYVGGSAYGTSQAGIHRGRWVTVRDALEGEQAKLDADVQSHLEMAARRVK